MKIVVGYSLITSDQLFPLTPLTPLKGRTMPPALLSTQLNPNITIFQISRDGTPPLGGWGHCCKLKGKIKRKRQVIKRQITRLR
ncbi:hypothetical protein, partial [Thermophagus sp. OGC60D27]|uniref:hypothetical protein n=1 Tax=Thermophagus sp. OGC60D27 TaxID=3458415 RepID=UPI0040383C65